MDGLNKSDATVAAEDAEFFDGTSLLEGATESNDAVAADSTVAVSATPQTATAAAESDDPLTLFSWQLKYRANSTFGNGQYEVRLILGADAWIRSGDSADALMTLMRDKAAEVVKKLES